MWGKKIGVIICYFGEWPNWFPFFYKSCINNHYINWLIFADHNIPDYLSNNIIYQSFSKKKFINLASKKLGFKILMNNPYKLCDFKPAYGKIFEDYIEGYDFWGYSDIDIIYGNIKKFITPEMLDNNDVISAYSGFLSGPFAIFRNRKDINELYTKSIVYKKIYQNPIHFGFDENIYRHLYKGVTARKLFLLAPFILSSIFGKRYSYKELRYQFQWYFKKRMTKDKNLLDITDILWYYNRMRKIRVYFKELVLSSQYFERNRHKNWEILFRNGELIEKRTKREILGFHLLEQKKSLSFNIPDISKTSEKYYINMNGFSSNGE